MVPFDCYDDEFKDIELLASDELCKKDWFTMLFLLATDILFCEFKFSFMSL